MPTMIEFPRQPIIKLHGQKYTNALALEKLLDLKSRLMVMIQLLKESNDTPHSIILEDKICNIRAVVVISLPGDSDNTSPKGDTQYHFVFSQIDDERKIFSEVVTPD